VSPYAAQPILHDDIKPQRKRLANNAMNNFFFMFLNIFFIFSLQINNFLLKNHHICTIKIENL